MLRRGHEGGTAEGSDACNDVTTVTRRHHNRHTSHAPVIIVYTQPVPSCLILPKMAPKPARKHTHQLNQSSRTSVHASTHVGIYHFLTSKQIDTQYLTCSCLSVLHVQYANTNRISSQETFIRPIFFEILY